MQERRVMMGTTISAVIEGDGLRLVRVSASALGARAEALGVVPSFLTGGGGGGRVKGTSGAARVVLTVPSEWVSMRAIGMGVADWKDGSAEVRRSVGGLLPLTSDDAMLGLIEARGGSDSDGGAASGYLVGVSSAMVKPWVEALERAVGRRVDRVMTAQMAMLGLGLQNRERADVLEASGAAGSGWVRHRLVHGYVERLGEPWSEGDALEADAVAIGGGTVNGACAVSGDELAVGAALAERVAGGSFVTLDGGHTRSWMRWTLPAGAVAAAAVLLVAGGMWRGARLEQATTRLDARIAQISADVDATIAARARAENAAGVIEAARAMAQESERKMLPALAAALDAVPEGGFISTMRLTRGALTMQGEAPKSGEVTRRLEESAAFEGAKQVGVVSVSRRLDERGAPIGETFDVSAQRTAGNNNE